MTERSQQNYREPGKLFIIFGPSGVGKTTLAQAVAGRMKGKIVMVTSYTTRIARPQEKNGVDYWFISQEEFERKKLEHFFLEYSDAYQASYGSSYKEIMDFLEKGHSVLIVIDRYGIAQVLKRIPNAVTIQIVPPTFAILRERLYKRSNVLEKEVEFRMQQAQKELAEERSTALAQFVIVNDDLDETIGALCDIINREIGQ